VDSIVFNRISVFYTYHSFWDTDSLNAATRLKKCISNEFDLRSLECCGDIHKLNTRKHIRIN